MAGYSSCGRPGTSRNLLTPLADTTSTGVFPSKFAKKASVKQEGKEDEQLKMQHF